PSDREALRMLILNLGLVDTWSLVNPQSLDFTFRSSPHDMRTRFNMIFISNHLVNSVRSCGIGIQALSDHAPVDLVLSWEMGATRKGRWQLNSSLLQVDSAREEIKTIIQEYFDINQGSVSTDAMLWEAGKAYIWGQVIAMSSRISELEWHIKALEDQMAPSSSDKEAIQEQIEENKAEYALFRLKHRQYESGDRARKLLASLVHQQEACKWIPATNSTEGNLLTEPKEVNGAFQQFYSTLCSSDGLADICAYEAFLEDLDLPGLSPRDRDLLDALISGAEIHAAIHSMQAEKSL
uniref:Endonuclease/exonuclease/phosphatase domain-containing protein n=1 Tax=Latimeria chalumnae TaxID=7897 RepID=H3AY12_LATCH